MERFRSLAVYAIAVGAACASPAWGAVRPGLWLGSATLTHVSEIVATRADARFDLGLYWEEAEEALSPLGASAWEYRIDGTDLGTAWREAGDTTGGWQTGTAPFGAGSTLYQTSAGNTITTYYRRTFETEDVSRFTELRLTLELTGNDGAVVYLNGVEVRRDGFSAAQSVSHDTPSSPQDPENPTETVAPASLLRNGENLLAVEVHRSGAGDADLRLDLALEAVRRTPRSHALLVTGSEWQALETAEEAPAAGWQTASVTWPARVAPLLYGESDADPEYAGVSVRPFPAGVSTLYYRTGFSVTDSAALPGIQLRVLRDDGAVVYLNGQEIYRSNMPEGEVQHDTPPLTALTSSEERTWVGQRFEVRTDDSGTYVVVSDGAEELHVPLGAENDLAVELHQHPSELGGPDPGPTAATRTPAAMSLRLLLHVNDAEEARLLKEVIQMYDSETEEVVLLTDDSRIYEFSGVALRDGVPVGRRVSAVGFDFPGSYVVFDGPLANGSAAQCEIVVCPNDPTNPFLHRYHPDHDNWDSRYETQVGERCVDEDGLESYRVHRTIRLTLSQDYPPGFAGEEANRPPEPLDWGVTTIGGIYEETLHGLHRQDIEVRGSFLLNRVSEVTELTE